ncbi:hypothetical protein D3850_08820 [Streptococcus mutans]|nr:hypothetical protein [Streptococcus mutans]
MTTHSKEAMLSLQVEVLPPDNHQVNPRFVLSFFIDFFWLLCDNSCAKKYIFPQHEATEKPQVSRPEAFFA